MTPNSVTKLKWMLVLALLVNAVACTHQTVKPGKALAAPRPEPMQSSLIREARREADLLRAELAAVKIAAARQQADLRSALERVKQLEAREENRASKVQQMRNDLLATQTEREQLRKENIELQAHSASLPDLQELLSDMHSMQASVEDMAASMKTLMTEVVHIKQDMSRTRKKSRDGTPSLTAFSVTTPSQSDTGNGLWTVEAGDTLWSIAQTHGISVDTLMDINELDSDFIVEGQALRVPGTVQDSLSQAANDEPEPLDETAREAKQP